MCLCVRVCQSVCQSLACPRYNSGLVQARITKFGPTMQKTLVRGLRSLLFFLFFFFVCVGGGGGGGGVLFWSGGGGLGGGAIDLEI